MHFMSAPQRSPRSRFGIQFVALARRWRHAVGLELAKAGLTDATWGPLVQLDEGGDNITQAELAARVGLDASTLVRLVDLLERHGFIRRQVDPADRRARRILLTSAGQGEVVRIRGRIEEAEAWLLADMKDEDIARALGVFDQIERRIGSIAAQEQGS